MGKIVIATNVSLDGVVEDPDGQEGFGRGGWFLKHGGKDLEEWAKAEYAQALGAAALLLGRRSNEWFGTRRPAPGRSAWPAAGRPATASSTFPTRPPGTRGNEAEPRMPVRMRAMRSGYRSTGSMSGTAGGCVMNCARRGRWPETMACRR
jgi:hypothetical protein